MAVAALSATLMAPLGANAIPEKTVVYHEDVKGLLVTPDNASKSPALILMHDFGGLDEEMRRRARAFAAAGFVALALDVFGGKTYASADAAQAVTREQIEKSGHRAVFRNMKSGLSYLRSLPHVDGSRVAVAGWEYGAAWSFHMAVAGFDIGASVVYYSDSGAITAPAAYRLEKMAAPPIAHYRPTAISMSWRTSPRASWRATRTRSPHLPRREETFRRGGWSGFRRERCAPGPPPDRGLSEPPALTATSRITVGPWKESIGLCLC